MRRSLVLMVTVSTILLAGCSETSPVSAPIDATIPSSSPSAEAVQYPEGCPEGLVEREIAYLGSPGPLESTVVVTEGLSGPGPSLPELGEYAEVACFVTFTESGRSDVYGTALNDLYRYQIVIAAPGAALDIMASLLAAGFTAEVDTDTYSNNADGRTLRFREKPASLYGATSLGDDLSYSGFGGDLVLIEVVVE